MYASQSPSLLSNGVTSVPDDVKPQVNNNNTTNGIAERGVSTCNGVSDLSFDTVEDTIEAFSTPC